MASILQFLLVSILLVGMFLICILVFKSFLSGLKSDIKLLTGDLVNQASQDLLSLTKEAVSEPISTQLETHATKMVEMQKDNCIKLGALATATKNLTDETKDVKGAAQQITDAFRSPNVKGRWGEMNLRTTLESVGLTKYCDFNEQVTFQVEDNTYQPDCVISIPGQKRFIVDSKVSLDDYLDATKETDEKSRNLLLEKHVKKVRRHIDALSKKNYPECLSPNELAMNTTILFIPIEGALSVSFETDPELFNYAYSKNIILAYPTLLIAITKSLSMTIQQMETARNIEEILDNATELYKRLTIFAEKFEAIGRQLKTINKSYNNAVGSFKRRLIPQARNFGALSGQQDEIKLPDEIESHVSELALNKD